MHVLLGPDTLCGVLTFSDSTYTSYGTSFVRVPGGSGKQAFH